MADSEHATLVADTVTTVTLDKDYGFVEVVNVDGAAAVYFTVNGATPTVGGDGTIVLPAAIGGVDVNTVNEGGTTDGPTTVKLISSGTPKVSVRGW